MKEYICKEDIRNELYDADAITMRGVDIINNYPVADVRENKRGKWLTQYSVSQATQFPHSRLLSAPYRCSCCNIACERIYSFCPNCGADMREEHDAK